MNSIKRVLALDVDTGARAEVVAALRALFAEAQLQEAASQREAHKGWIGEAPCLVVLGEQLADESGVEAAQRIRRLAPETRLMVYAPAMSDGARAALAEIGCAAIAAPLTADKVVAAFDSLAAGRAVCDRAAAALAFA